MEVTIEKKVTQTVNVESGYYKYKYVDSSFYYLRPSGTLIHINSCSVFIFSPDRDSYKSYIKEIIEDYIPCQQSEFEMAKDRLLVHLANYIVFPVIAEVNPLADSPAIHTMTDPNVKQAEEANQDAIAAEATGQPAEQATEGTDNAQDSEEGTTEG